MVANGRHLSAAGLAEYVAAGNPAAIPIVGEPDALLTIHPQTGVLRLEISWDGVQPPAISNYLHLATDVLYRDGRNWAALSVRGLDYFLEAYPLLCSVADRVQLEHEDFTKAVNDSLHVYHDLLAAAAAMSTDEELGLYGELLVLAHLVAQLGGAAALDSWRGGDRREEHDFGLPADDVEVKATSSEGRRHRISSLPQLTPTTGRPLWLVSVQLTAAGLGDGRRLPDLIDEIQSSLPAELVGGFHQRLGATGFRPDQARGTYRLLRLRSTPACFRVDDDFPRLTLALLQASGADVDRIEEVRYAVRLDNVKPTDEPPVLLRGLLAEVDPK